MTRPTGIAAARIEGADWRAPEKDETVWTPTIVKQRSGNWKPIERAEKAPGDLVLSSVRGRG